MTSVFYQKWKGALPSGPTLSGNTGIEGQAPFISNSS